MYGMLTQSTSTSTGLIAQWELEPTSSFATNTYTLSAAEAALITDFNDLYVSFASYSTAPHLTGNIDLNFQTGEYYEVGVPQSTITSTSYLSCSRASIGYAKTAAGTLTQFGNDTLRITSERTAGGRCADELIKDQIAIMDELATVLGRDTLTATTDQTAPDGTSITQYRLQYCMTVRVLQSTITSTSILRCELTVTVYAAELQWLRHGII